MPEDQGSNSRIPIIHNRKGSQKSKVQKYTHIPYRILWVALWFISMYFLVSYLIDVNNWMRRYDYSVYLTIYRIPITAWYRPFSDGLYGYYYSPFFYILFYPLRFLSFTGFLILGSIVFFLGIVASFSLRFDIWILMIPAIAILYWFGTFYGNVEIYLFGIIMMTHRWVKSSSLQGLIIGICTFKGTVGYVIPFFFLKTRNKRNFFLFLCLFVGLNYAWFLLDLDILFQFLDKIRLEDHNIGPVYLAGLQYTWFIGIIFASISDYLNWLDWQHGKV